MKKVLIPILLTALLVFAMAMYISGRNICSTKGKSLNNENVFSRIERHSSILPDSIISLLTVVMPETIPQQLLLRKAYLTSYNSNTLQPNYVAWALSREHSTGPYRRERQFHEDEDVKRPRATLDDYRGSGWTRGHLCPAGDNKWDREAMYESFALTNVCPQDAKLNNGPWNSYEMDCRRWAEQYGEIYIVSGPMFFRSEHERIGRNQIPVPKAFFKVVLCLKEGNIMGLGIIARNGSDERKQDIYRHTIREVERITGYDFFSALPDSIEDKAENTAWRQ